MEIIFHRFLIRRSFRLRKHIDHVATQMPYALTVALCASVGYILSGITGNGYIGLAGAAISLALAMVIIVITAKRGR